MKHKWKRLLCIGAALTLTGQMLPVPLHDAGTALVARAVDYEEYTEDGITYAVYDDHAEVLKADNSITRANILSEVNGKAVTKIAKHAFENCAPKSITFPESITRIDSYAFYLCQISSITIPEHITVIDEYAFEFCIYLTSVTIPDSIERISVGAFWGCTSLESISIGKNVNYIGKNAFACCPSLQSVSVDSQNAYYLCDNGAVFSQERKKLVILPGTLTEYQIPDGVTECYATSGHKHLKQITVPSSVKNISFLSCAELEQIKFENGITNIQSKCFCGTKSLKVLELPASVESVGDGTFEECESLSALSFMNPSCTIGDIFSSFVFKGTICGYNGSTAEAFANENGYPFISLGDASEVIDLSGLEEDVSIRYYSSGLTYDIYKDHAVMVKADDEITDLVIPERVLDVPVTVIAEDVCENSQKLKSVQIPKTVTEIKPFAFYYCNALEQIQFSEGLITMRKAFRSCDALTTVDLPASLEDYYGNFDACDNLTAINAAAESEYFTSQNGILYSKDMTKLYLIPGGFSGSYTLPDSVEEICSWAADDCSELTEVRIGRRTNLRSIGYEAFDRCISLTSFFMPDTVTKIGAYAFDNCVNLKQIRLSSNLQEVSFAAFENCEQLESINVPASAGLIDIYALGGTKNLKTLVVANPETEFSPYVFSNTKYLGTIYGYADSTAQTFAEENGYPFVDIASLTDETVDGIKYQISDGKATVVGYEEGITEANIPENVFGLPVVAIADEAFKGCETLKALTITDGLSVIGQYAFAACINLEGKVSIPDSVETIGESAFSMCYKVKSFDFGEGLLTTNPNSKLREIDTTAFYRCTSLQFVMLPPSVQRIGHGAFSECESLTLAYCGKNVETIEDDAFSNCTTLVLLALGSNLKTLGDGAFADCKKLLYAEIPETTESIGLNAFAGCSNSSFSIQFDNPNTVIDDSATTICSVISPASFIGTIKGYSNSTAQAYAEKYGYTFQLVSDDGKDEIVREKITYKIYDDHAEVISCEDTVQKAEIYSVVRGLPVTVISDSAFKNITSLETVSIPDSVRVISDYAFSGCTALSVVFFGNGIEEIGRYAFSQTAILSLTVPDSVKSVGNNAFNNAASLRSVTIGKGLTELGVNAFSHTESLYTFIVDPENTSFKVQDGLLYSADGARIYAAPCDLKEYQIPDGVTDIHNAFRGLKKLVIISVPASVTMTDFAFQGCTALTKVKVDAETIGQYMFANCTALETVYLDNIRTIEKAAFQNCGQLNVLDLQRCGSIGDYALGACPNLTEIGFRNPNCVISNKLFSVNSSTLTDAPFTGTIFGYDDSTAQTFADENSYLYGSLGKIFGYLIYEVLVGEIIITGYFDNIPENAEIPAEIEGLSVTVIGFNAFGDCSRLKEIQFPDTLKRIGTYAFYNSGLKRVTIPESVEEIHDDAFCNCDDLAKVIIGAEAVANYVFYDCDALTDVTILETVKTIGVSAFRDCDALTEITIPDTVELIEQASFNHNPNLEKITVGAKTLSTWPFSSNPKLKEVTFTENVTTIGEMTFAHDAILDTVEYPASVESIGPKQFEDAAAMNTGGSVIIRNPECVLDEAFLTSEFKGTVYGYPNSTAQTYCEAHHFKFAAICNVSYDGNGAKGEMEGGVFYGEMTLPECGFTAPTGKKFVGWSTGDGGIYPAGMSITLTDDTVLTANWQTATVTVTLDANGGSGTALKYSVVSGSAFTFPTCTFTAPDGKQFAGWQLGEKTYQPGDSLKVTENNTVKALWEDILVTVSFDANGSSGTMDSITVIPNMEYTLPDNAFEVPVNCEFLGWQIGDKNYKSGDTVTITSDTVIKALWSEPVETVLIGDANGDGTVDDTDAMLLARYVAKWDGIELDLIACDLNDDGEVDDLDAMILARYIADWDGYVEYIVKKTV